MRFLVLVAALTGLATSSVMASPLIGPDARATPNTPFTGVHHKPWHRGGPPWMRRGRDRYDDDDRRDRRDRRARDDDRDRYDNYSRRDGRRRDYDRYDYEDRRSRRTGSDERGYGYGDW